MTRIRRHSPPLAQRFRSRWRRLLFESFEPRLLLAADAFEPNDSLVDVSSQTPGAANSPNLGTLAATRRIDGLTFDDAADWFQFTTTDHGTSHDSVRIEFVHSQGDLNLYVYRADGSTLVGSSTGYSNNESVSLAEEAPGNYFAVVRSRNNATNPAYSLQIDPPGNSPDDAYEPNDTLAAIDLRPAGGVHSPNLGPLVDTIVVTGLALEDQADFYRFETSDYATSHDTVTILFSDNQGDLNLHVYRGDGTALVGSGTSYGDNETVSLAGESPGVFYARVTGRSGDANSSYSLRIDPPGNSTDDAYEPNDTAAAIDLRPAGGVHSPNLGPLTDTILVTGLALEDQADFYRFETSDYATSHDTVTILFSDNQGDLNLHVYRGDGTTQVGSGTSYGDNETVSLAGESPGVFYARVTGRSGDGNPAYSLRIDPPGNSTDDAYEPNDTAAAVALRPPSGVHSPNLGPLADTFLVTGLALEDQADYYRFETSDYATSHDTVTILFSDNQGDLNLHVYRGDGTTLVGSGTSYGDNETVSLAGESPGVFYARVTGRSGDANASYSLRIDPPGNSTDDAYEPNDTADSVLQRMPGGYRAPNLGRIEDRVALTDLALVDQADYYAFEMANYGQSTDFARVEFSQAAGDLNLYLYAEASTNWLRSATSYSDHEQLSLEGFPPGRYLLAVVGRSGDANPSYQLVIQPPVAPAPRADLFLSAPTPLVTRTWIAPGAAVGSSWYLVNQGNAAAGEFDLSWYLSADGVLDAADQRLATRTLSLPTGASYTASGESLSIPASTAPGEYTLILAADAPAAVSERSESNNRLAAQITISPLPAPATTVRGTVYADANANRFADAGEAGLAGVTVYIDQNGDGRRDAGEATAFTDAQGRYEFAQLPPGWWSVRIEAGSRQTVTFPHLPPEPGIYVIDSGGILGVVDPSRGVTRVIGNTGQPFYDIAFDPWGRMFGITTSQLFRIDPRDASVHLVGSHGAWGANSLVFAADGGLYAQSGSRLYRLDPRTAAATEVAQLGSIQAAGDLAFHQGRLYVTTTNNQLAEIMLSDTVEARVVGPLGQGNVLGMVTGGDGLLYGLAENVVLHIDPTSGAAAPAAWFAGQDLTAVYGAAVWAESFGPYSDRRWTETVAGQPLQGVDFGVALTTRIDGSLYHDDNRNRVREPSEPPLTDWYVFLDRNRDGSWQADEPRQQSSTTGAFSFDGITPGTHRLQVLPAEGWGLTAAAHSYVEIVVAGDAPVVSAGIGADRADPPRIAGLWPPPDSQVELAVGAIQIDFTQPMDPATLWTGSFVLLASGGDGSFHENNERNIGLQRVEWDPVLNRASLRLTGNLPRDHYRLRVRDLMIDLLGTPLDGQWLGYFPTGDLTPGGDGLFSFFVANSPPEVEEQRGSALQGVPLSLALLAGDADGDALTFALVSGPAHGQLNAADTAGNWTYTADSDYTGSDQFRFRVTDARGAAVEAVYQLRVNRSPADLTPVSLTVSGSGGGQGSGVTPGLPFHVAWSVSNVGPGATADHAGRDWIDEIYLSSDALLDASDMRLLQWSVDTGTVAAGQTQSVAPDVPLEIDPDLALGDTLYLIVQVDARRYQADADRTNNLLARQLELQPGVQVTSPVTGRFVQRGRPLELQWRAFDPQRAGTLTFAIDSDAAPSNGQGHQILATGIGANDQNRWTADVPDLSPGTYYLWARLEDGQGAYYSPPLMVQIVDEALLGAESLGDAVGGASYEVFGVEAGRIGDEVQFRVRTNFDPRNRGGDIYLNLGGSFDRGNGTLAGIAVNSRTARSGAALTAGTLYTGASFQRGSVRSQHPTFIADFASAVTGRSAVRVDPTPGSPWRFEISGSFLLSDLGASPGDPLQIGWAMYCGNDFGHAESEAGLPDLSGAGLAVQRQAAAEVRWGDSITLSYTVANQGPAGGDAGASQMQIVLAPDPPEAATAAGELSLVTVQVAALTAGQQHAGTVTVTLPATPPAGFPAKGPIYLAMIQDVPETIEEGDEANNRGLGVGTDVAVLQVGGPPQFVTVLTHGFNPTFWDFPGFWTNWDGPFDAAVEQLAAQQGYAGDSLNYVTHWQSSEGWIDAIVSTVAYVALAANPNTAWLSPLAFNRIAPAMQRAERFAYQAALKIVADLISLPDHLGGPEDGQQIHLIGHSRGAAVNAYASYLLQQLQYPVAQYSALDGYSTDWPNISGILGDISIVNWATAARKTNYRVEAGLLDFEALGAFIDDLMWHRLPWLLRPDLAQSLGDLAAWRAPARGGYGFDDEMIWGYGSHPRSNHMNVSELYFFSDSSPFAPQSYLRNNPLGRATPTMPATPAVAVGSSPEGELNPEFQLEQVIGGFETFVDGSFDQLGDLWRQTEALAADLAFDDPFLEAWWEMVRQPQYLLPAAWSATGDVRLQVSADDSWLELTQTENTAVGQYLVFSEAAEALVFDLHVIAAGPEDRLTVLLDGEELLSVPLTAPGVSGVHTLPLQTLRGRSGELLFALGGPLASPARVELDDLRVVSQLSLEAVALSPGSPTADDPLVQIVASGLYDPLGVVRNVAFFLETNGQPGLQTGPQGDQVLGRDLNGSNGWTLTWDTTSLPGGTGTIYAQGEAEGALRGRAATAQFFLSGSAFPWQNSTLPEDVNDDGIVSALDALLVINHLNLVGPQTLPSPDSQFAPPPYLDVSGDNQVSPIDVLMIINEANRRAVVQGVESGEAEGAWVVLAGAREPIGTTLAGLPPASFRAEHRSLQPPGGRPWESASRAARGRATRAAAPGEALPRRPLAAAQLIDAALAEVFPELLPDFEL